jgi:hypothetical protein
LTAIGSHSICALPKSSFSRIGEAEEPGESDEDEDGAMLIVATLIYFLPTIIALARGHLSTLAIFLLNLFLGWTLLGWIIALIWSCTGYTAANFYRGPEVVDPAGRIVARRSGGSLWIVLILILVAIAILDKHRHFRDLRSFDNPFPSEDAIRL